MKAEYMAVVEADKEIIWMKEFIRELGIREEECYGHERKLSPGKMVP